MDPQQPGDDQGQPTTPSDDSQGGMGDNNGQVGGGDQPETPAAEGEGEVAPPTPTTTEEPTGGDETPSGDSTPAA